MPEGPEIRIAADKIASVLVDHKVCHIQFAFSHLRKYEKHLKGNRVTAIKTHGKAMLIYFDSDRVIYSHNQLYGRWYVTKEQHRPNTKRQLRLLIETIQHSALLYSASDIEVLKLNALEKHPFLSKLGPDILSENPSTDEIVERLQSKQFFQRQLAALLLDQSFMAGLGNYLRAEILFFSKLNPKAKPSECSVSELQQLAMQICTITKRSYLTKGLTNPPVLVKQLKAAGKRTKSQYRFSVYGRAGKLCYYCGSLIQRARIGGRDIYFCPTCQTH